MIGRVVTRTHGAIKEALCRLALVPDLGRLMQDPQRSASYHPAAAHKSRLRIWREQLSWLFRHGEVNRYYWIYGFDAAISGGVDDYLPYREFMRLRDAANRTAWINGRPLDCRSLLRDKLLFGALLKGLNIAAPPLLAYGEGDTLIWLDHNTAEPAANLAAREGLEVFVKDSVGECATGVWHLRVDHGHLLVNDEEVSPAAWLTMLRKRRFIVEGVVRQHPDLARLHSRSVNTLRLVTVLTSSGTQPFSCILRVGCGGRRVDNTAQGGALCEGGSGERRVEGRRPFPARARHTHHTASRHGYRVR